MTEQPPADDQQPDAAAVAGDGASDPVRVPAPPPPPQPPAAFASPTAGQTGPVPPIPGPESATAAGGPSSGGPVPGGSPFPADRPEIAVGAAFAGGLALALILKRLAR